MKLRSLIKISRLSNACPTSHTDSGDCHGELGGEREVHALADTAVATRRRALERVASPGPLPVLAEGGGFRAQQLLIGAQIKKDHSAHCLVCAYQDRFSGSSFKFSSVSTHKPVITSMREITRVLESLPSSTSLLFKFDPYLTRAVQPLFDHCLTTVWPLFQHL